ncbi:site-specific tyrosine recombinase XerC [Gemmata sp. SH-PL17]|uniref:tyrosine-type recombinase/integrase n=1 Tax=Gemmata sp. SH-PL17 TaxID=1630693 RepID=UPI00078C1833|nr:site-specific integrase [Gemmata sp. SH-PL17]AMV24099.1 site-specific tyrosine recombinase XerC [Gemmata sp. SH-PL17]
MARKPGIWLRKGTPWYYVTLKGDQIRLSKDEKEAQRMFHELMAKKVAEAPDPEPPAALGVSFKKLADEYLKATQGDKGQRAFQQQTKTLQLFSNHVKKLRADEVRPHMVRAWLATKPEWNVSTQSGQRKTIKAVLNWAVKEGYLNESPLKKMAGGEALRRDRVFTEEEKKKISEFVSPDFADFLKAIELTGARPFSEMAQVTATDVDLNAGTITLQKHKNRKKTGKPRTIFLVPELLAILKKRVEQHPNGPLFQSRRGAKWNSGSSRKWFSEIEKELGIKAHAYVYRHSYITAALIRGVPVEVVAELVGNTPSVLHRNYAHVGKDKTALKAAALKAVTG